MIHTAKELHLHQMQIEPEFQKKGLGAKLISKTIVQSEELQIPITLFVITKEYEYHCKMYRQPKNILNN